MKTLYTVTSILFLTFCVNFVLYGNSEKSAKEILSDALNFMQTQSYKTFKEIETPDKKKLQINTYHSKMSNGINLLCFDVTANGKTVNKEITNEDGVFAEISINDDEKINVQYEGMKIKSFSKNFIMPINVLKRDISHDDNVYEIKLVEYADVPCYKVIMRTKMPDPETIAKLGSLNLEDVRNRWQMFLENYPLVTEFIIGKEIPFIYQSSFWGSTGIKTFSYEYGIPEFTEKINLDLFKSQSLVNLLVIRTDDDLAEIQKKIYMERNSKE